MKLSVGKFLAGYFRKQGLSLIPCVLEINELFANIITGETANIADIEKVSWHGNLAVRAKARGSFRR